MVPSTLLLLSNLCNDVDFDPHLLQGQLLHPQHGIDGFMIGQPLFKGIDQRVHSLVLNDVDQVDSDLVYLGPTLSAGCFER